MGLTNVLNGVNNVQRVDSMGFVYIVMEKTLNLSHTQGIERLMNELKKHNYSLFYCN